GVLPTDRDADDGRWCEEGSCDPRRRFLPAHVDAVRIDTSRILGIVVHEEGDLVAFAQGLEHPSDLKPFPLWIRALVSELDDRRAAIDRGLDHCQQFGDGTLRRRDQINAARAGTARRLRCQAISPESARLKATQKGSRSAGRNGRPRSRQGPPFFVKAPMSEATMRFRFRRARTSAAAPSSTAMSSVPSLIASSGSMSNTLQTAAADWSMYAFDKSTSTPRPEACAISHTALRTPPSVASCIAHTPPRRSPRVAAARASSTVLMDSNRACAFAVMSAP